VNLYNYVELSLPDLSKLIGEEWKKLNENQKSVSAILKIINLRFGTTKLVRTSLSTTLKASTISVTKKARPKKQIKVSKIVNFF